MDVAIAIIENPQGEILISKRPPHAYYPNVWEFPGGKFEPNESAKEALKREIYEELHLEIQSSRPLITVEHDYGDRYVHLYVHKVISFTGTPHGKEGQEIRWVTRDALDHYTFPEANVPIRHAVQLPQYYAITPEATGDLSEYVSHIKILIEGGIRLLQLRALSLCKDTYLRVLEDVLETAQICGAKVLCNAPLNWIEKHTDVGWHASSQRLSELAARPLPAERWVAASCHSLEDLKIAEQLGLDFAVLSPIAATLSHPEAQPMGWETFKHHVRQVNLPVYALGGLNQSLQEVAYQSGGQGIAGIRCFWPNLR